MTIKEMKRAVAEAKRFITAATEAIKRFEDDKEIFSFSGTKESGAARRASMDLTRALAAMRKS